MNGKLEEHLQNIGDFIQIDDKIVTYKWISKSLKVHSNTAKQLLYSFTQKPDLKDQLLITYVVAGEPNGSSGLNFRLVRGDELEETKKKFSKITSIHVYSVQKGRTVSGADIYNAEGAYKISHEDKKYCSIQPADDIKRREIKVPSASIDPTPTTSKKEPQDVARRTSPRKASPKKNDVKKPAAPNTSGGIGALFMKQVAKKKGDTVNKTAKKEVDADNKEKEKSLLPKKENDAAAKNVVNGAEKDTVKTPSNSKGQSKKKKRKKASGSKDSAAKRRKRIQVASDSESSEKSESDDDQRYPSPEPEPEAPTVIESEDEEIIPATPVEKGRKRVRKQVDKTYTDDEGYIITKKEYVFESCSDDESSEPAKKKSEPIDHKEPVSKLEEKTANEATTHNNSGTQKEGDKKKEAKKSAGVKKTESAPKKPGRPPAKPKANVTRSPKKQASITNFFKKK